MTHGGSPSSGGENRTDRVDQLVTGYVDRLIDGETLDFDEIVIAHPDIGEEIVRHLRSFVELGDEDVDERPLGALGDYTLRRQIGRGGMGVVYEAWQNSLDRQVALKVLPAGVAADTKSYTRFLREAQIAAKISHPHVVGVHGFGVEEHTPYYAMEYVEGETLAEILVRVRESEDGAETPFGKKGELAFYSNLASAFADVADGLQHAHSKGIIHRDIKPSNLILDSEGRLRVLDFGLAQLEGQEALTMSGDVMGTPLYMSPEQARRRRVEIDHRTDIYSLGTTIYEAITGQPPFRGRDHQDTLSQIIERDPVEPSKLNLRVPKDLETIALKCLRKEPEDRYGTADALGQDLRRFVRGDPIEARPEAAWASVARRWRRHRTSILVVSAIAILTVLTVWFWHSEREADRTNRTREYDSRVRGAAIALTSGQFSARRGSSRRSRSIDLPIGVDLLPLLGTAGTQSIRDASEELRRQAQALPERIVAHYHLARAYRFLGETEEAAGELERALGIDPDFVPAVVLASEISGTTAQLETGEWLHRFGETNWRIKWLEAHHARRRRAWNAAAEAYGELIEIDSEPYIGMKIEAYLRRGVARLELKQHEKAKADFITLRVHARSCVEATLLLGKAYLGSATEESRVLAEELFDKLRQDSTPEAREEASLWIALIYTSRNEFKTALAWTDTVKRSAARERLRSYLFRQLGEWDESAKAAEVAIEADPDSLEAYFLLAGSLLNKLASGRSRDPGAVLKLAKTSLRSLELKGESRQSRFLVGAAWEVLNRQSSETSRRKEMIDLRTRFRSVALTAGIVLSAAGSSSAQQLFDDFDDGALFDGKPFWWGPECPWSDGIYDMTEDGLEIGSALNNDPSLPVQGIFLEGDVSVRTRVSTVRGSSPGLAAHGSLCGGGYVTNIRTGAGSWDVTLQRWDGALPLTPLDSKPLPADFVPEDDHLLQIDVRGDVVEVRMWKADEPMPTDAFLSMLNFLFAGGPAPPAPFPECAAARDEPLSCDEPQC